MQSLPLVSIELYRRYSRVVGAFPDALFDNAAVGAVAPMTSTDMRKRTALSKALQIRVFRRDCWMCRWCGRPVVFPPAMRMLDRLVRLSGQ